MKRVTVLVCVYNDEATIGAALESALEQTAPRADYVVLVVDDGSDDGTPAVLDSFRSRGVDVLSAAHNQGLVHSCNEGLAQISTPFYVRLDGDDTFEPDLIASLLTASDEAGANVVTTDRWEDSPQETRLRELSASLEVDELIAAGTLLPTDVVRQLGGYRELFWEEVDLYVRLLESGHCRFTHVSRPLYRYKVGTPNRLTSDLERLSHAWEEIHQAWPDDVLARYRLDRATLKVHDVQA